MKNGREIEKKGIYLNVLSNDRTKCEVLFIFDKLQSLYEREGEKNCKTIMMR